VQEKRRRGSMVNAKQKGKRVELEIAHWLGQFGLEARRTQQFNGAEGLSDVVCEQLRDWHIEVKGTASPTLPKSILAKWYAQIFRDCPVDQKPVIFNKANGKDIVAIVPLGVWKVIRPVNDTIYFSTCVEDSINPSEQLNTIRKTVLLLSIAEGMKDIRTIGVYYALDVEKGEALVFIDGSDFLHLIRENPTA